MWLIKIEKVPPRIARGVKIRFPEKPGWVILFFGQVALFASTGIVFFPEKGYKIFH
jgi:hypothetical protein